MLYTLTITPEDGKGIIEFGKLEENNDEKGMITGIDIKLDTTDDNVRQNQMQC